MLIYNYGLYCIFKSVLKLCEGIKLNNMLDGIPRLYTWVRLNKEQNKSTKA